MTLQEQFTAYACETSRRVLARRELAVRAFKAYLPGSAENDNPAPGGVA